jgi:hypothetical protein
LIVGPFAEVTVPAGVAGGATTGAIAGALFCGFNAAYDRIFGE